MDKLKLWEDATNSLQKKINEQMNLTNWKFAQNVENGELLETDDSRWEEKEYPNWSKKDGPACFRKMFVIPGEIEGIPTENSNIDLTFLFPSGVELFIDGKRVYEHRYWADKIATPFPFIRQAKKGEKHLIVFKTPAGDGLGSFWVKLNIDRVEDILFELNSILYQVRFAFKLAEDKGNVFREYAARALTLLDPDAIEKRDWNRLLADIKRGEKELEPFRKYARRFRVHLVGHAHIDMNWLWNYEDTIDVCLRDFKTVNKLMEKYPDLRFSQSQAHVYKIVEEHKPELFRKVKDRVKEGRWEVTASSWVEGDLNMAGGESIIRHILYAGRYTQEKLDVTTDVFWSPDTFGHPATIPSILNSAGIRYYYFMRCGKKGRPLFIWKARDGGELLAFNSIYNNVITPERIMPDFMEYYSRYKLADFLFVYGIGDHGGGPTEADIKRKKVMESKPVFPTLEFSTVAGYFQSIKKHRTKLPVVTGELNTIFEGCYTTHSDIKKSNRQCENLLLSLETLLAIGALQGRNAREAEMEELWQNALFNQFHDILDGTAIHSSYEYSAQVVAEVMDRAEKLKKEAITSIPLCGTGVDEENITVFNPLGWERSAFVSIPGKQGKVTSFVTPNLCPYGYRTFSLTKDVRSVSTGIIKQSGDEYENGFYRVRIDSKTGLMRALYDKKNKCEVLSPCLFITEDPSSWWAEKAGNLLSVSWEKPHSMSAWIIGNVYRVDNIIDAENIETSTDGLCTTISIKRRYMDSEILQKIILYPDFPFIDFENRIDWRQEGNNKDGVPMVRVNFNLSMKKPDTYFEVPFGVLKRETMPKEYPALRWAGFNSGRYWTALFNKDKHGYYLNGNSLSLTLLRNAYEPDAVTDNGIHNISYRLYFGKSDVLELTRAAMEYNIPPMVVYGKVKNQAFSPFTIKGDVLPSCFKKTLGRDSYILRLVEVCGKKQNAEIEFAKPPKRVYITDSSERRQKSISGIRGSRLRLNITPYQIVTLELVF